jgi:hypothetical protein
MKLHPRHGASIGLCVQGQRRFCEANGIDFRRFIKDGIPLDELRGIDDLNLKKAIAVAEAEQGGDDGDGR